MALFFFAGLQSYFIIIYQPFGVDSGINVSLSKSDKETPMLLAYFVGGCWNGWIQMKNSFTYVILFFFDKRLYFDCKYMKNHIKQICVLSSNARFIRKYYI